MFFKSIIVSFACSLLVLQRASAADHFFPERPSGATIKTVTGTLIVYGHGEGIGGVQIRDSADHVRAFFMGYPMKIDGRKITCFTPPDAYGGNTSDLPCNDWPSNVRLGYTVVTVSYWQTAFHGKSVEVTDQLRTRR